MVLAGFLQSGFQVGDPSQQQAPLLGERGEQAVDASARRQPVAVFQPQSRLFFGHRPGKFFESLQQHGATPPRVSRCPVPQPRIA